MKLKKFYRTYSSCIWTFGIFSAIGLVLTFISYPSYHKAELFGIGLLVVVAIAPVIMSFLEAKRWNRGVCSETGERWEMRETNVRCGRLYRSGNYAYWISWIDEMEIGYSD